jgi:hypothetical protein
VIFRTADQLAMESATDTISSVPFVGLLPITKLTI